MRSNIAGPRGNGRVRGRGGINRQDTTEGKKSGRRVGGNTLKSGSANWRKRREQTFMTNAYQKSTSLGSAGKGKKKLRKLTGSCIR